MPDDTKPVPKKPVKMTKEAYDKMVARHKKELEIIQEQVRREMRDRTAREHARHLPRTRPHH